MLWVFVAFGIPAALLLLSLVDFGIHYAARARANAAPLQQLSGTRPLRGPGLEPHATAVGSGHGPNATVAAGGSDPALDTGLASGVPLEVSSARTANQPDATVRGPGHRPNAAVAAGGPGPASDTGLTSGVPREMPSAGTTAASSERCRGPEYHFNGTWQYASAQVDSVSSLYATTPVQEQSAPGWLSAIGRWASEACWAESMSYSFTAHGSVLPTSVVGQRFVSECIVAFDPDAFLNAVANRNLFFVGDSVMGLLVTTLLCHLGRDRLVSGDAGWKVLPQNRCPGGVPAIPGTDKHCGLLDSGWCVQFKFNVSICFYGIMGFWRALNKPAVHPHVFFVNWGVHANTLEMYKSFVERLAPRLASLKAAGTRVVWTETLPTFFASRYGLYVGNKSSKCITSPLTQKQLQGQNWRNHYANPIMRGLRVDILRWYGIFVQRHDAVIGNVAGTNDCLHLGYGGALEIFPPILQTLLAEK